MMALKRQRKGNLKRRRFTLVEALLSLSVAGITAAILVPATSGMITSARKAKVQMELNAIATGFAEHVRDMGFLPTMTPVSHARPQNVILHTDAPYPESEDPEWQSTARESMTPHLCVNQANPSDRWAGPYLSAAITEDPWGNAYVVNVGAARGGAVYALSAGPNGVIETPYYQAFTNAFVLGDDRVLRLQ